MNTVRETQIDLAGQFKPWRYIWLLDSAPGQHQWESEFADRLICCGDIKAARGITVYIVIDAVLLDHVHQSSDIVVAQQDLILILSLTSGFDLVQQWALTSNWTCIEGNCSEGKTHTKQLDYVEGMIPIWLEPANGTGQLNRKRCFLLVKMQFSGTFHPNNKRMCVESGRRSAIAHLHQLWPTSYVNTLCLTFSLALPQFMATNRKRCQKWLN